MRVQLFKCGSTVTTGEKNKEDGIDCAVESIVPWNRLCCVYWDGAVTFLTRVEVHVDKKPKTVPSSRHTYLQPVHGNIILLFLRIPSSSPESAMKVVMNSNEI